MFSKSTAFALSALAFSAFSVNAAPASNAQGNFGKCSVPQITFATGLDGRTEAAFVPTDKTSFNHGSAQQIDVIADFICQQVGTACGGDANAVKSCNTAKTAALSAAAGGAQADAFNAGFGAKTNFGAGAGKNTPPAATPPAATPPAAGNTGNGNPQTSLTLDPKVIATGFEKDGQEVPTAGQVPSLTSTNNFANFCLTVDKPITNGLQIKTGSCNPAPMGTIPSTANMPSSKFTFPTNFATIKANTAFTITMAIKNIQTGNFVNAQSNYYAAPQQLNGQGIIIGHTHVVVEKITSLTQTTVTDPNVFAFFKGVNGAAVNGVLSADVTAGLPAGFYRLASINAAMNHQPVLAPVAQHGSLDDMVYFEVTESGAPSNNAAGGAAAPPPATPKPNGKGKGKRA